VYATWSTSDDAAPVVGRTARHEDVEVGEREAVVLVVVSQEREGRVLVLHLGVEHRLVPAHHLLEAARAVDDVDELGGADAGHGASDR